MSGSIAAAEASEIIELKTLFSTSSSRTSHCAGSVQAFALSVASGGDVA
jgi:hypothetical protein